MGILGTVKLALSVAWAYISKPELKHLVEILKVAANAFQRGETPEGMGRHIYPLLPDNRRGWVPGKDTATKEEIDIVGAKLHAWFMASLLAYNAILALYTIEERLLGASKPAAELKTEEKDSILSKIPGLGWLSKNKDKTE